MSARRINGTVDADQLLAAMVHAGRTQEPITLKISHLPVAASQPGEVVIVFPLQIVDAYKSLEVAALDGDFDAGRRGPDGGR